MRGIGRGLGALPPLARWSVLASGGLLVVLVLGTGIWSFLEQREASAGRALAAANVTYRHATVSRQNPELTTAAKVLSQFLEDYPRSTGAAQAWYLLGNVEYQRGGLDAALKAYDEAAQRGTQSIAALSRLGRGYVWEAKGDPSRALGTYTEALQGRGPNDFLYAELLLGKARMQEQLARPAEAIETYRKLLADVPDSPHSDDVRSRLATLGAGA